MPAHDRRGRCRSDRHGPALRRRARRAGRRRCDRGLGRARLAARRPARRRRDPRRRPARRDRGRSRRRLRSRAARAPARARRAAAAAAAARPRCAGSSSARARWSRTSPGVGELTADDVELVPDAGGVRVSPARSASTGTRAAPVAVELAFARSAAELVAAPRASSAACSRSPAPARSTLGERARRRCATSRSAGSPRGGPLELRAALDDGGVAPRRSRPSVAPRRPRGHACAAIASRSRALAALAPHGVDARRRARHRRARSSRRDGRRARARASTARSTALALDHRAIARAPGRRSPATLRGALAITPDAIAVRDARARARRRALDGVAAGCAAARRPRASSTLALAPAPCTDLLGVAAGRAARPARRHGDDRHVRRPRAPRDRSRRAAPATASSSTTRSRQPLHTSTPSRPAADVTALAGVDRPVVRRRHARARSASGAPGWVDARTACRATSPARSSPPRTRGSTTTTASTRRRSRKQPRDRSPRAPARARRLDDQPAAGQERVPHAAPQPRPQDPGGDPDLAARGAARQEARSSSATSTSSSSGPHVFGIGAAAQHWFGESPRELVAPPGRVPRRADLASRPR